MAILAVLTGLVLGAVQKVRATAARAACQNNLRQIGVAATQFEAERRYLPVGSAVYPVYYRKGKPPEREAGSALFHLLPYLDQEAVWLQADAPDPFQAAARVLGTPVRLFRCPARDYPAVFDVPDDWLGVGQGLIVKSYHPTRLDTRHALTDYGTNMLLYHLGFNSRRLPTARVTDGLSNTVFAAERAMAEWRGERRPDTGYNYPWASPLGCSVGPGGVYITVNQEIVSRAVVADREWFTASGQQEVYSEGLAGGPHPGVCNVLTCDGAVHTIRFDIPVKVWSALVSPNFGDRSAFE
jgi:prepilin-type processing-associated H-X9-DG protein